MELRNDALPNYKPLLLLPNTSYPTYQLHAFAGGRNAPAETVLKIAVLETSKWLRQRFRAFDLPDELDMPAPESHESLELSALKSFHLDMGYKLHVLWLPGRRIWTLQLTEPDMGTNPGQANQLRPPVPGRLFETNISYRVADDLVECGFKTVVHEPQGTTAFCEVFRLAFIKHLARNPLVGLRQTWQLIDGTHDLTGSTEIKKLAKWLDDPERMLPAVILSQWVPEPDKPPNALELKKLPDISTAFSLSNDYGRRLDCLVKKPAPEARQDFEFYNKLARYKMGYAMFFTLPAAQREVFRKHVGQDPKNGDILIAEPSCLGGRFTRYTYGDIKCAPEAMEGKLEEFIQNYPKGKAMSFGNCVFVPQGREIELKDMLSLHRSKEELVDAIQEQREKYEQEKRQIHRDYKIELRENERRVEQLTADVARIAAEKEVLIRQAESDKAALMKRIEEKDCELNRFNMLQRRPSKPTDIAAWMDEYFKDRLLLHDRARDMLQKLPPGEADVPLMCDALEFLAMEYRDRRLKLINEAEYGVRCSKKYNRPFEVTSTKSTSVEMYPSDYKIKYKTGYKGKPVETLMDLHLKVSNDPENLLRIYFLYDSDTDLVVVGSLPKHLKTKSYK